ncbi:MAG: cysteine--tRNA ligase [Candidatus Firestonebacteria bacterium]|nr:cysteine--tRNA ligase [Candidatus Firestonebacteria bacterium]
MPLMFLNTLSRRKEAFVPQVPGEARVYACGPTVYDYFHVGNARAFVVFDTLRRVLSRRGFKVTFVQNITDIDDKIINRANKEGRKASDLAEEFTQAFRDDIAALGNLPADITPRATEHMPEIIAWVKKLIETKHAYVLGGDVYFAVRSFAAYGKVSGKDIEELEEGARVEVDRRKKDPLDFALWKAAKPGEPSWESPWGLGRPGWHIECSAMSMKYLGDCFDIHGGGEDLIFPHHENENAQSEAVTGKPLARIWLHNGHLNINGEKMSKSLGNFRIVRDILGIMPREVLRLFLLSAHYRSPLDFNPENIEAMQKGFEEIWRTLGRLREVLAFSPEADTSFDPLVDAFQQGCLQSLTRFDLNLDEDMNTAGALGELYSLANQIKKLLAQKGFKFSERCREALSRAQGQLLEMLEVFGVAVELPQKTQAVLDLAKKRQAARQQKDWPAADQLRLALEAAGFWVEDMASGAMLVIPAALRITKETV